jgi:glycine/D-amino acid oxidase-like deaminating enzyme
MASGKQDEDEDEEKKSRSKSQSQSQSKKMRDEDAELESGGEEEESYYEVVVVGAGIMGSCTAYEAAKRGASVMLVEQYDLLHARGSSHGETRNMRSTYPDACYTHMVHKALQLWDAAQAEAGYRVHTETPHLDFGPAANRSLSACIRSCSAAGVPFEELASPAELAARFRLSVVPDFPSTSGDRYVCYPSADASYS